MKFSIVIPTRNRLRLLREAVKTVRLQTYSNWEIIIFDNASKSKNDIQDYLNKLDDKRIKYFRSPSFLPVAESWNNAIKRAKGDYIVLIGDDDGLCPNYFETLIKTAKTMNYPELIYNSFYQFWHPGVAPWEKKGHVIEIKHGFFFEDKSEPFFLKESEKIKAIKDSLDFSISFSFNSQACVYKRSLYNKIKEGDLFYKSPYPDFYIANVAMYMSASTAVIPEPIAIAGVSKASVGYTIYNDQDLIGEAILNNDLSSDQIYQSFKHQILSGPAYNTNYFIAMKYVENKLGNDEYKFNFNKYRKIQLYEAYSKILSGINVDEWWPKMRLQRSFNERLWCYLIYKLRDPNFRDFMGKNKLLNLLKKKISMSGHDPHVKKIGLFDTCKVSDIFKYLNEKK